MHHPYQPPYGYPPYYPQIPPPIPPPEEPKQRPLETLGVVLLLVLLMLGLVAGSRYILSKFTVTTVETAKVDTVKTDIDKEYPTVRPTPTHKPAVEVAVAENAPKKIVEAVKPVAVPVPVSAPVSTHTPVAKSAAKPVLQVSKITSSVVKKRLNYRAIAAPKAIYIYSTGVFTKGSTIDEYVTYLGKTDTKIMYHYLVNNKKVINCYPVTLQAAHGSTWANENGISIAISPNTMSVNESNTAIVNTALLAADLCRKYHLNASQVAKGENAGILNDPTKWKAFQSLLEIYLR